MGEYGGANPPLTSSDSSSLTGRSSGSSSSARFSSLSFFLEGFFLAVMRVRPSFDRFNAKESGEASQHPISAVAHRGPPVRASGAGSPQ